MMFNKELAASTISQLKNRSSVIDHIKNEEDYTDVAIHALRRQIPKKPDNMEVMTDFNGGYYETKGDCPRCGRKGLFSSFNYCHKCGQALDWKGEQP